ncbi:MAG: hypothetical protein ACI8PP_001389, partial [Candidatus Pseudothioglobus sp.]
MDVVKQNFGLMFAFYGKHGVVRSVLGSIVCLIALASCGGGGGGAELTSPSLVSAQQQNASLQGASSDGTIQITGAATKGPIRGASVAFYAINEFGFPLGSPIANTTTDNTGNFTATLPAGTGAVLVETRGGAFIDESDQEPDLTLKRQLNLSATQGFVSLMPAGATTVAVTPFSQALVEKARLESQTGDFNTRFPASAAEFNTMIGFDVLTTIPANPLLSATDSSPTSAQYALLLGGIANVINNVSIQLNSATPTFEIITAVISDLADGAMDGRRFTIPVTLTSNGAALPTNINFTAEMSRFKSNNFANFSTVTPTVIVVPAVIPVLIQNEVVVSPPIVLSPPTPVATPSTFTPLQSELVVLDASASTDDGSIVSFQWVQVSGPTVVINDATTSSASFVAPTIGVFQGGPLEFQLQLGDDTGLTSAISTTVQVAPVLGQNFIVVEEPALPRFQGINIGESFAVALLTANTGTLTNDVSAYNFVWSLVGAGLRLDFSAIGGLPGESSTSFEDDGNGSFLEVTETDTTTIITLNVVNDGLARDAAQLNFIGTLNRFDLTNNVALSPIATNESLQVSVYDRAQTVIFSINPRETLSLLVDSTASLPGFVGLVRLSIDALTFEADGTGNSDLKAERFTWQTNAAGQLQVNFQNGDAATYFLLAESDAGDTVAVRYVFADTRVVVSAQLSYTNNPAVNWDPSNFSNNAGSYTVQNSFTLDDGREVLRELLYRINPDGTGVLELESVDPVTGLLNGFFVSSFGICASINAKGDLVTRRVRAFDERYQGSRTPSVSTCSTLTTSSVSFQRDWRLYDISPAGEYLTTIKFSDNACGINPIDFPGPAGCDSSQILANGSAPRISSRLAFNGPPPFAIDDTFDLATGAGPATLNVLANDLAGGSSIDPATVEIIVPPLEGTATVDVATGNINYLPNAGALSDVIYYRVKDISGNLSTAGLVSVTIGAPNAVSAVSDTAPQAGDVVSLDASGSTDNDTIVSYVWQQISGDSFVFINNNTAAIADFTAPGNRLISGDTLVFRLDVTDADGLTSSSDVTVDVQPFFSANSFGFEEFTFEENGAEIGNGFELNFNGDGTG